MKQCSGSVGLAADHDTNSSALRPAQHSAIARLHMSAEVLTECIPTHVVEAFFQQCAPLSTVPEIDLLNSLFLFAEVLHAVLPRSVSLQEWASRRVPRGLERQVNNSGMVYVGDRFLQYVPHLPSELRAASSAAQPSSDSIVAQPASVVEERVLDVLGFVVLVLNSLPTILQMVVLNGLLIIVTTSKARWLQLPHRTSPIVMNSLLYYNALTERAGSSRRSSMAAALLCSAEHVGKLWKAGLAG